MLVAHSVRENKRLASFDHQRRPDSTKQVGELLGVLRTLLGLAVEEVLSRLTWVVSMASAC